MTDLVTGDNLGAEFDQGTIQPGKIRLKLGAGLAIQPDGTIVTVASTILWGRVTAAGVQLNGSGATVAPVSTGIYQVTFNSPQPNSTYGILLSPEGLVARDDYFLDYFNVTTTGFQVRGTEQDNGAAAGVFRNMGFTFQVIGGA